MDKRKLLGISNWVATNAIICASVYFGLVKGNMNAQYIMQFLIIIFFIGSLLSLSKDSRTRLQANGRTVPAWLNSIVDYTIVLTLVYYGWFWYGSFKLVENICFTAAYNKEGWDD